MTDKKAVTSSRGPEIQSVVDLLTDILDEFRKQVQSKTPEPLEGKALEAVNLFREIGATLALLPTITLTADPAFFGPASSNVPVPTLTTILTWSSTEAQTVSIVGVELFSGKTVLNLEEVTPTAGGSTSVAVVVSTRFTATATARGPCGGATAIVDVIVGDIIFE